MEIGRRGLLAGILAAACGPAIVRASSLMPVRVPKLLVWPVGMTLITQPVSFHGLLMPRICKFKGSYEDMARVG